MCDIERTYLDRTLNGLTAVFAPELTRESVFDALRARRCYATTGVRILMDFEVNGLGMGQQGAFARPARVRLRVAGTAPLKTLTIVRNNEDVHRVNGTGTDQSVEWADPDVTPGSWYYARIEQTDGHFAWASPVWLG